MKKISTRTKILTFIILVMAFFVLDQALENSCPKRLGDFNIDSTINIKGLYPWPGAKIPFACHMRDYLKSPLAPTLRVYDIVVYKEDGIRVLRGSERNGVFTANIFATGEFLPTFNVSSVGRMPLLADRLTFYIDGQELKIGHISWKELDVEFHFATIFNPLLLPGKHTGKIVLLLDAGDTQEFEWQFEVTWW